MTEDYIRGYLAGLAWIAKWIEDGELTNVGEVLAEIESHSETMSK